MIIAEDRTHRFLCPLLESLAEVARCDRKHLFTEPIKVLKNARMIWPFCNELCEGSWVELVLEHREVYQGKRVSKEGPKGNQLLIFE